MFLYTVYVYSVYIYIYIYIYIYTYIYMYINFVSQKFHGLHGVEGGKTRAKPRICQFNRSLVILSLMMGHECLVFFGQFGLLCHHQRYPSIACFSLEEKNCRRDHHHTFLQGGAGVTKMI